MFGGLCETCDVYPSNIVDVELNCSDSGLVYLSADLVYSSPDGRITARILLNDLKTKLSSGDNPSILVKGTSVPLSKLCVLQFNGTSQRACTAAKTITETTESTTFINTETTTLEAQTTTLETTAETTTLLETTTLETTQTTTSETTQTTTTLETTESTTFLNTETTEYNTTFMITESSIGTAVGGFMGGIMGGVAVAILLIVTIVFG